MKSTFFILLALGVFKASPKPKKYLIETVAENVEALGALKSSSKPKIYLVETVDESVEAGISEERNSTDYQGEFLVAEEGQECSSEDNGPLVIVFCEQDLSCVHKNGEPIKTCQRPTRKVRRLTTSRNLQHSHMHVTDDSNLKTEEMRDLDASKGQDTDHSSFESETPADDEVVTVTAKFWYVSDFKSNATDHADSYVTAMNNALENSQIPILYKRWGSIQKLPRSHAEMLAMTRGQSKWHKFNDWFVNSLGRDVESHRFLKQSADHIVLMHNRDGIEVGDAMGACTQYGPDSGHLDGEFDGEYNTVLIGSGGGSADSSVKLFVHEAGHCLGISSHTGYCLPGTGTRRGDATATIMTISNDGSCFPCCGGASEWILHFSNPDVSYEGIPTGDARSNNAKKITENRVRTSQAGDECWDGFPEDATGKMRKLC